MIRSDFATSDNLKPSLLDRLNCWLGLHHWTGPIYQNETFDPHNEDLKNYLRLYCSVCGKPHSYFKGNINDKERINSLRTNNRSSN